MSLERLDELDWVNPATGEIATAPPPTTSYAGERVYEQVPPDDMFDDMPYLNASDLHRIAAHLISQHGQLVHLRELTVLYRWKREGGRAGGSAVMGRCKKIGAELYHETGADFWIWLAADHVRDFRLTERQVEALLFHELLHTGLTDKGKPMVRSHDAAMFISEIRHYGLWFDDLEAVGMAVNQLGLFEEG